MLRRSEIRKIPIFLLNLFAACLTFNKVCLLVLLQLIMKSETKYFSEGTIIADSHELAKGLMVITSGLVTAELPMDSKEAVLENSKPDGKTLPSGRLPAWARVVFRWQMLL